MNAPIKYLDAGEIEGLAIAYGSPARLDAHGEYFSAGTDFLLDLIVGPRPLMLHHGMSAAGPEVIGRIVEITKRPEGVWIKAVLDKASRWFGDVKDMLQRGRLSFSSGTLAHLIQKGPDGQAILRWPLVEVSLTPRPADPAARVYAVRTADLAEHVAAIRGYGVEDRDELRLIKAHLDGIEPHRGLVTAWTGAGLVIQREVETHVAGSS